MSVEKTMYGKFKRAFDFLWRKDKVLHYFKFPDMNLVQEKFDAYCLYKGRFYAIEYKLNKNKNKFSFASIFRNSEHEIKGLTHIQNCGGRSVVVVEFENIRKTYWFSLDFVLKNYTENLSIGIGNLLNKVKTDIGELVFDIKLMLYE